MERWLSKIRRSTLAIRFSSWEYWPFGIVQFPLFFYFAWLAIKARSLTFFSASNPGIIMGGMFGESKYEVLEKVPDTLKPVTLLMRAPVSPEFVLHTIKSNGLSFPVVFKPDIGERGFMVNHIHSEDDVSRYLHRMNYDFIIQELIDDPVELGVFYQRFPLQREGRVTSIVMKEMLFIEGDGISTLEQLILKKDRAKLQWPRLKQMYRNRLTEIVPLGMRVELVSIGNHCLGTRFINANHFITQQLTNVFDEISKNINGFYFGRYDLRCRSIEDLVNGRFKVLELNGCGAEPGHIYDPGFPLLTAMSTLFKHWENIYEIADQNRRLGHQFLPFKEAIKYYKIFKHRTKPNKSIKT